ncbi:mitochondrial distribution and morphology protein 10 [Aspergillus puulaauensis]|uniref:Mitochondrial distribution and morphology protein 10 n=1 Tax=Aspergillus puulaauensis TaxID=1220207 RepID=A0A7R8AJ93_9EURO|nr:mitochondrial distribution and morphology protein 10 [Aspergillus puulaauensis]BCS19390.1 mitochondrial distribution and morphology protein 10 [Aspergillus puulaauensis]
MLDFMDYIQLAFAERTQWNRDNSYSSLTATTQSLLDFTTPERVRVHLSSLSTPNFATSYTLGTVGLIEGSVSYLYSNISFDNLPSKSALIPLRNLAPGYRQVQAPIAPSVDSWNWDSILDGIKSGSNGYGQGPDGQKATLLHATLHLPPPTTLNALFLRRISPTMQLSLAVSSTRGPPLSTSAPQATLLTQLSHDTGKYSNEYLFSTDNSLFGWRGLWNFGPDPRFHNDIQRLSLLSAGAEAYYSPVSSLIGMSTGLRFSTLPAASIPQSSSLIPSPSAPISTFPYTLTLTLTPLTGSLSTSYSLRASPNLSFSSRFGFNVYSWESEMVAGFELWRQSKKPKLAAGNDGADLEWARRKVRVWDPSAFPLAPPEPEIPPPNHEDETQESVLKLRVDQSWNVRLLWEGRVKELLVSAGVGLGPSSFSPSSYANSPGTAGAQGSGGGSPASYWRGVGVSVSYSS